MKKPVILDTDIGIDIDDTWALAMLLNSPELDLRLVSVATGDAAYRARLAAKFLDRAGRAENGDVAVFHKGISFLSAGEPVIQYADRLFKITVFHAHDDG